jgi:hypothetical protein
VLAGGDRFQAQGRMARGRRRDHDRVDVRQGIREIGVRHDAVFDLLIAAIEAAEPLVDLDDFRYPGGGPQHAHVPRSPIADTDHPDPDSR